MTSTSCKFLLYTFLLYTHLSKTLQTSIFQVCLQRYLLHFSWIAQNIYKAIEIAVWINPSESIFQMHCFIFMYFYFYFDFLILSFFPQTIPFLSSISFLLFLGLNDSSHENAAIRIRTFLFHVFFKFFSSFFSSFPRKMKDLRYYFGVDKIE